MRFPLPTPSTQIPSHPSLLEQHIAIAIVLWIIVAGFCVIAANAWAMGAL